MYSPLYTQYYLYIMNLNRARVDRCFRSATQTCGEWELFRLNNITRTYRALYYASEYVLALCRGR